MLQQYSIFLFERPISEEKNWFNLNTLVAVDNIMFLDVIGDKVDDYYHKRKSN